MTLNQPWSNTRTTHQLIILDICAELFVDPTRGSKDIEPTRKRDGQTDGQIDRLTNEQTDNRAKNNMSPHFMGGDIITIAKCQMFSQSNLKKCHVLFSYMGVYLPTYRLFYIKVSLTIETQVRLKGHQ